MPVIQNIKMKIIKNFLKWIGLKEKIHGGNHTPPFFKEGEIWWCYVGENVGVEVNGKGGQFTRPIFILKKYDRYSFLGLPLTTKSKIGTWYVAASFQGSKQTVVLSQGRVFDYRRFKEKMGELDEPDVERIIEAYAVLHCPLKNRPPVRENGSRG